MHSHLKFLSTALFFFCSSLTASSANAQTSNNTVSLSGTVLKPDGTPLKKCIVSLRKLKMKDTTDSDGYYSFNVKPKNAVLNENSLQEKSFLFLTPTMLNLSVAQSGSVYLSLLDLKGQQIYSWKSGILSGGNHAFTISELVPNSLRQGMYIMQLKTDREIQIVHCVKAGNTLRFIQKSNSSSSFSGINGTLSKTAAVVDTIDFKATGYKSKAYTLSSYSMRLENVTLEKTASETQPISLTSSLLSGKWACIFYNQDGCEDYVPISNYTISNMTIIPNNDNIQFIGTWGTYQLAGAVIDQKNLLIALSRSDAVFNYKDVRLIAVTQSHPNALLAGSVFSGVGIIARFNLTTGLALCQGTFDFMMVRDFTAIGGTSSSSGNTYNPSKSGFESNQNDCLTRYLRCSKACSIGAYMDNYSTCIAKCDDEKNTCDAGN